MWLFILQNLTFFVGGYLGLTHSLSQLQVYICSSSFLCISRLRSVCPRFGVSSCALTQMGFNSVFSALYHCMPVLCWTAKSASHLMVISACRVSDSPATFQQQGQRFYHHSHRTQTNTINSRWTDKTLDRGKSIRPKRNKIKHSWPCCQQAN